MRELGNKAQELLEDLPAYCWDDPAMQGMMAAVGNELQRIEDFIVNWRLGLMPQQATGALLDYWENFLDLPVGPAGIPEEDRREIVMAAVARRGGGLGSGWVALLTVVADFNSWRHSENTNEYGDPADYELAITDVDLLASSWRSGVFHDTVKKTTPAHLEISEIEIAGDDSFRVGISEVGDEL